MAFLGQNIAPESTTDFDRWSRILHDSPPHRFMRYDGVGIPGTIKLMREAATGRRGEANPGFKQLVHTTVRNLKAKDYVSEAVAWFCFTCQISRYVRDPVHVEFVQDPVAFYERGCSGDCDELAVFVAAGCMSIGNPCRFVTGGFKKTPEPFFSHVWTEAFVSRLGCWVTLDPVAGPMTQAMLDGCAWRCNYPLDPDMGSIETIRCW